MFKPTLRSWLLTHWGGRKMAEKVNKRYTCSCYNFYLSLFRFYFLRTLGARNTDKTADYDYVRHLEMYSIV